MNDTSYILIVEDNPLNLKLMRDLLDVHGYTTQSAETAERGLEMVSALKPDLILMDIHLPGMSGVDALKQLKADPETRDIPIIAVTASVMPDESEKVLASGFDGFQAKPLSFESLLADIRRLLK